MKIILLRHVESEKNIKKSFSSEQNQENITIEGDDQACFIADSIYKYAVQKGYTVQKIYAANSKRAIETANKIAFPFGAKISAIESFLSVTTDKSLKGKSEDEIVKTNPQFIHELSLYRAGLFSAYNYSTVADVIKTNEYERNIMDAFNHIINDGSDSLKIVVLHHSSITALLINIARLTGNYPTDFYGHVEADLGKIYVLNYDKETKSFSFDIVNSSPNSLLNE